MNYKLFLYLFILSVVLLSCRNNYHEQKAMEQAREKEYKERLVKANRGMVKRDSQKIVGIIRANQWDMQVSGTGLWYEILEHGKGKKAEIGNRVQLLYKLKLLNGDLCYTSDSTGPMQFLISKGGVERGLEEGILMLREGDSARFIMPYYMAHHLLGDLDKIPPLATIIYEVRVKTVRK